MLKKVIQAAFLLIGGALGLFFLPLLYELINLSSNPYINNPYVSVVIGAVVLFVISFIVADYFVHLITWMEEVLFKLNIGDVLLGTIGLILGLSVAALLGVAIKSFEFPIVTQIVPTIFAIIFGYLGFRLGYKKREELMQLFTRPVTTKKKVEDEKTFTSKLLDTSVIIDGRIADICATGFVEGTLIVPQFVLTELQYIADSSDTLKRVRGRRGLDILKELQDDAKVTVQFVEDDFDDISEVDLKLVKLAKLRGSQILTNDFNLNKVCELHQVQVLNINDLANAVKQVVIPGENMHVVVVKEGKEHNQGLAYLDDGTMIVIENGHRLIGQAITVEVTSVLQTSAGRMIFAKPNED